MNGKFRQMHTPILFAVSVLVILLSIFSNTKDVWRTLFVSIVLKEIGSSNLIGSLAGIGFGMLIGWVVNVSLMVDETFFMNLFALRALLAVIPIPLAVTLFCMIPPLRLIREDTQL